MNSLCKRVLRRANNRRRGGRSRSRPRGFTKNTEPTHQIPTAIVEPMGLEDLENKDHSKATWREPVVLLHTPENPLKVRVGMFLRKDRLAPGYLITERHQNSRNRDNISEYATQLVVTMDAKQVLEDFVDLERIEIKKELISTVFTVNFEAVLKVCILEVPEDGSFIDTTQGFEGCLVVHPTKVNINRSELCSMLVNFMRNDKGSKIKKMTRLDVHSTWRWPRLRQAKQDYTFLGTNTQDSTIFLAKPDPNKDYEFDQENWENGSELYTETTVVKLDNKSVLTYSLRTLQGIVSVIFDSKELQLRFTKFLHTIISGTSELRLIGLWTYKLKIFCTDSNDQAIWITDEFNFKGTYSYRAPYKAEWQLELDLRSATLLKLANVPKFVSKHMRNKDQEPIIVTEDCFSTSLTSEEQNHIDSGIGSMQDSTSICDQHPLDGPISFDDNNTTRSNSHESKLIAPPEILDPVREASSTTELIRVSDTESGLWATESVAPQSSPQAAIFQLNPMMGLQQFQAIKSVIRSRKPLRLPPKPIAYPLEASHTYRSPIIIEQHPNYPPKHASYLINSSTF